VLPASLIKALPNPAAYAKVKFASLGQITRAKALIQAQWSAKVG